MAWASDGAAGDEASPALGTQVQTIQLPYLILGLAADTEGSLLGDSLVRELPVSCDPQKGVNYSFFMTKSWSLTFWSDLKLIKSNCIRCCYPYSICVSFWHLTVFLLLTNYCKLLNTLIGNWTMLACIYNFWLKFVYNILTIWQLIECCSVTFFSSFCFWRFRLQMVNLPSIYITRI